MSKFKVGDTVVCLEDRRCNSEIIIKNNYYIIGNISIGGGIRLLTYTNYFHQDNFCLCNDTKNETIPKFKLGDKITHTAHPGREFIIEEISVDYTPGSLNIKYTCKCVNEDESGGKYAFINEECLELIKENKKSFTIEDIHIGDTVIMRDDLKHGKQFKTCYNCVYGQANTLVCHGCNNYSKWIKKELRGESVSQYMLDAYLNYNPHINFCPSYDNYKLVPWPKEFDKLLSKTKRKKFIKLDITF